MLAGGVLGLLGMWSSHAEWGLMLSVPALLGLVLLRGRVGLGLAALCTAMLGLLHGAAHRAELAPGVGALGYFAGFTSSAMMLIAAGMGLARLVRRLTPGTKQAAG
jgi:urease accessory protein